MKDAKGHGSNKGGGGSAMKNWLDRKGQYNSDNRASMMLAGGHPKSVKVPVHVSMATTRAEIRGSEMRSH